MGRGVAGGGAACCGGGGGGTGRPGEANLSRDRVDEPPAEFDPDVARRRGEAFAGCDLPPCDGVNFERPRWSRLGDDAECTAPASAGMPRRSRGPAGFAASSDRAGGVATGAGDGVAFAASAWRPFPHALPCARLAREVRSFCRTVGSKGLVTLRVIRVIEPSPFPFTNYITFTPMADYGAPPHQLAWLPTCLLLQQVRPMFLEPRHDQHLQVLRQCKNVLRFRVSRRYESIVFGAIALRVIAIE